MALETFEWNVIDHLTDQERMIGYLEAAFETGDAEFIVHAINDVAQAMGKENFNAETGDLGALIRSVQSLGFELTAKAA